MSRSWGDTEWHEPIGRRRGKPNPTMELKAEFAGQEKPWVYPLALNGRKLEAFYINGVRQVPAPERDWDDCEVE